jgi:hypothetical protein
MDHAEFFSKLIILSLSIEANESLLKDEAFVKKFEELMEIAGTHQFSEDSLLLATSRSMRSELIGFSRVRTSPAALLEKAVREIPHPTGHFSKMEKRMEQAFGMPEWLKIRDRLDKKRQRQSGSSRKMGGRGTL